MASTEENTAIRPESPELLTWTVHLQLHGVGPLFLHGVGAARGPNPTMAPDEKVGETGPKFVYDFPTVSSRRRRLDLKMESPDWLQPANPGQAATPEQEAERLCDPDDECDLGCERQLLCRGKGKKESLSILASAGSSSLSSALLT